MFIYKNYETKNNIKIQIIVSGICVSRFIISIRSKKDQIYKPKKKESYKLNKFIYSR